MIIKKTLSLRSIYEFTGHHLVAFRLDVAGELDVLFHPLEINDHSPVTAFINRYCSGILCWL